MGMASGALVLNNGAKSRARHPTANIKTFLFDLMRSKGCEFEVARRNAQFLKARFLDAFALCYLRAVLSPSRSGHRRGQRFAVALVSLSVLLQSSPRRLPRRCCGAAVPQWSPELLLLRL